MTTACGCTTQRRFSTLADRYQDAAAASSHPPLIVIPGAFGSRLSRRSTREEIWPGSNVSLVFGSYRDIELAIDPHTLEPVTGDVETSGIFLQALGRDFYGDLLRLLETVGGYRRGSIDGPANPEGPRYYVYTYDWRLDATVVVRGLHRLIERVVNLHPDSGPAVDVVAHSNGGTIARYYARYGTADVLGERADVPQFNGSDRIRRLLLVGTPNLGTIQAVLSHVRGEEVGLRRIPAEVVATCPSVPQLMPHPGESWMLNMRGEPIALDMYDIETWRELGWSIFSDDVRGRIARDHGGGGAADAYFEVLQEFLARQLGRGRRFHESLSGPARPDEPRPFVFGSDCLPTLAKVVVDRDGATYRAYEQPHRIALPLPDIDYAELMYAPGDGVVTRSSLLGEPPPGELRGIVPIEVSQSAFVCEPHQTLTGNVEIADRLLAALLTD